MSSIFQGSNLAKNAIIKYSPINYRQINYSIIVAYCKNYGIGYNNTLPWDFKSDLKHFYNLTTKQPDIIDNTKLYKNNSINQPIIMGNNTWKSLNYKPLKKRLNIVLTSNIEKYSNNGNNNHTINNIEQEHNVLFFNCPYKVEDYLKKYKYAHSWIIGGSSIYNYYLKNMIVNNIYSTFIHENYNCDSYFLELKKLNKLNNKHIYGKTINYDLKKSVTTDENGVMLEYQYWKRVM